MKPVVSIRLISAASAEIVSNVSKSNAPCMRTHNAMLRDDTNNYIERTSMEFQQTNYAPLIQLWTDFTSRSTRVRGIPPVVDGIGDRIKNNEHAGPHKS